MFCKICDKLMKHLMRFDGGKSYELFQCPYCYWESKKTTLKFPITKTEQNKTRKSRRNLRIQKCTTKKRGN